MRGPKSCQLPNTTSFGTPGVTLHYEILRPHARGGLGEVYVARDPQLGREVAVKEIHAEHARVLGLSQLGPVGPEERLLAW